MVHELKIWPVFYNAVITGIKPFDVRKNDRDFNPHDLLHLREYDPHTESYTGREMYTLVTYVLGGVQFGIEQGYVVMGIKPILEA